MICGLSSLKCFTLWWSMKKRQPKQRSTTDLLYCAFLPCVLMSCKLADRFTKKTLQNHCKRAAAHLTLFELWLMNFNEQLLDFMIFLFLQQHWLSETSAYDEETRKQLLNKNKKASFCFTESRGDFIVFLSYVRDWGEL